MAVVATAPLTRDEAWQKAAPGTLWVLSGGDIVWTFLAPDYVAPPSLAGPPRGRRPESQGAGRKHGEALGSRRQTEATLAELGSPGQTCTR